MAMRARVRIVGAAREASLERPRDALAGAATRRKQNDSGPYGSGRTAEKPSPVSAAELNDVLAAAHARVDKLEPRLAAVIEPILKKYGDAAARKFSEHATQHLVAAGPDWTAPFPDQLIDVDALVAEILAKTQPVRDALIEQTMSPALAAAGIRFDVANPLIAGQIANTGAQVTNIAETTRANIMRIIGQATQNGLTVPQTSSLIREGMASASKSRSVMIARTEMARAVNGGSLTATQMVASATGAAFSKTWHCVAPWTRVSGEGVLAVIRKPYEGELVTVTCKPARDRANGAADFPGNSLIRESFGAESESQPASLVAEGSGSAARLSGPSVSSGRFTVTSDHLVLTRRGWVAAGLLQPGDNVVGRSLGQEHWETPDVDDIEATAEEIFDAAMSAAAAVGVMSAPVYLDDGSVGEKIDIPAADSSLRNRLHAALPEPLRQFMLAVSDMRLDELFRDGSAFNRSIGHRHTTSGGVTTSTLRAKKLGLALMADQVGFTLAPQLHTVLDQDLLDESIGDPKAPAESLHRLAPLVRVDEIVQVERRPWSGHVYDVTTLSGWFFADGYVAHNTAPGATYPRHENYEGLDGQTVGLDAAFDVGGEQLQYPGDPSGDPGETISCRCAMSYMTPSGEQEADAEDPPELDTIDTAGDGGGGGLMAGPDALTQPLQPLTSSNNPVALARSLSGRARSIEPAISKAVSASADAHGAQLAGYEYRLKKEASAARKIAEDALERGKTARETAYEVSDMVRYTATFSPEEYVARSDAMLRDLQSRGIKVVRFRNTWEPDAPYAGLNVQMAAPNGYRFELQFHTADSFYLKEAVNHPLCEEWRLSTTSQARKTELLAEMRANVAGLTVPEGVRGYEFADTPAATDIAVTPFRPQDDPIGFYDSQKYQAFVDRAHTTANDYGVVIDKIEHTTGVWQGETEPSASISAHDGDVGLKAFSASLGGDYGQDAVLVFNDVPGEAMMATFTDVQAQSVYFDALREAGIEGARITVDGRLQVIGGGVEFAKQLARLGELLDSEYEVGQGTSTLLERDAYKSAVDLFRNGPTAAPPTGEFIVSSDLASDVATAANTAHDSIASVVAIPKNVSIVPLPETDTATARLLRDGSIGVSPNVSANDIVHEFGHYIDSRLLGPEDTSGANIPDSLYQVMKNSPTMVAVRDDAFEVLKGDTQMRNYFLQGREMFARAFDQYVAEQSGDPVLLSLIDKVLADPLLSFQYWTHDEFVPISNEITRILKDKGLLRANS